MVNKDSYVDDIIQTVNNCKKGLISSFSDIYQESSWDKCFTEDDMKKLVDELKLTIKKPGILCRCIKFYCSEIRELRLLKDGRCNHCGSGVGMLSPYEFFSIPFFDNKCKLEFANFTDETTQTWLRASLKNYQPKSTTLEYVSEDASTGPAYLVTVTCKREVITHKEDLYHYSRPKITYPRGVGYNYQLEQKIKNFQYKHWLNICVEEENLEEFLSINNLVKE